MAGVAIEMEALECIEVLNAEIGEMVSHEDIHLFYLEFKTDGYCSLIEFMGYPIWNSEDDEREWINDDTEQEPLEGYIRKRINAVAELVKGISL